MSCHNPDVAKVEDASKVEAVVSYCEPLATQKMRYHWLSRRVNNAANIVSSSDYTTAGFVGKAPEPMKPLITFFAQTLAVLFMQH
jgi:hypothetical protein